MDDHPDRPPLREPTFFILLSLAPDPRHGYGILKDVQSLSAGRVSLSTGTLYGAIKRLFDQGWITRTEDPSPDDTDRIRKYYALTEQGRGALEIEIERLDALVAAARLRTAAETP